MTGAQVVLLACTGALLLPGIFCLWRLSRCSPAGSPGRSAESDARRVSVIVPARDEERRITPLLESLARQSRRADEVLVIDDGSTDGTAALARRLGATVVATAGKPVGWLGKTWACWSGAHAASGDIFVFLDADTLLADDGLECLLATLARRGGLVSVQPYDRVIRPYERLSAVCNIMLMGSLGAFTLLGDRVRTAGSFGPCLAVTRTDYLASGGHEAVRGSIVEDMALGKVARSRGLPVARLAGGGTISMRGYPDGIRAQVEGWSKSMATGAAGMPELPGALMVAWLTGAASAIIVFALGIAALAGSGSVGGGMANPWFGAAGVGLYVLYAAQMWWMMRRIGSFGPLSALLYPLPLAFFYLVFARSAWLTWVRGMVTWRGRRIEVRDRRAPPTSSISDLATSRGRPRRRPLPAAERGKSYPG